MNRKALEVFHGIRAVITPMFGKQMEDQWFTHMTETDVQAILVKELQTPVRSASSE